MAKPKRTIFPGHKVTATVKSVKGKCSWGHEEGDTFSINCQDTAGLCGFFYHDIFPLHIHASVWWWTPRGMGWSRRSECSVHGPQ
jgi:hypothetical protein